MFTISKDFTFSASHAINGLPDDHPCRNLHGHNYLVRLHLQSETLDEVGFIVDYKKLNELRDYLDTQFDHRHLNQVIPINPTTELLCKWVYDWCKERWSETCKVEISEPPKTWASYSA